MPDSHVKQRFSAERLLHWAENIGVGTRGVVQWHIHSRKHPEQAIKSCLAILNLTKQHGAARLGSRLPKGITARTPSPECGDELTQTSSRKHTEHRC